MAIARKVVEFTEDLSIFKRGHNRPLDTQRAAKIAQDIMGRKNLLHAYPIIVSEAKVIDGHGRLEVIDGDHRLEAARIAGVGVYYRIIDDMTADDQARSNSLAKSWSYSDWAHYWAGRTDNPRHKEYRKLLSIAERYDAVPFNAVMTFSQYGQYDRRSLSGEFRDGTYVCVSPKECETLCQWYLDFADRGMPRGTPLQGTVALLFGIDDYDHERMMQQIDKLKYRLEPRTNARDNIAMLQDIYNFNYRGPNRMHLVAA